MNSYNNRLDEIINKYFDFNYSTNHVINYVSKILRENCESHKFAIWGAGGHTVQLHKYFSRDIENAICIIDNDENLQGTKLFGLDIIAPEQVIERDIKVILISSYSGAIAIEKDIAKINNTYKVVNIYTYLRKMGIQLNGMFYAHSSIYSDIYKQVEKFNLQTENNDQLLKKIIYLYLLIRDFKNAFDWINKYVKAQYNDISKILLLKQEIEALLKSIEKDIVQCCDNNILLLFVDSLRAKDVYEFDNKMPYLHSLMEKGISFTKMYAPSIYTYESMVSVLGNSLPLEKHLYKNKVLDESQAELIQKAKFLKYDINIYSMAQWDIIRGDQIKHIESNYVSQTLWNAVCNLVSQNNKHLDILYIWQETHPPHMCGKHKQNPLPHVTPFSCNEKIEQSQEDYIVQVEEALMYVDEQIQFYFNILPKKVSKVIFSDHGQVVEKALDSIENIGTLAGWHTDRFHVPTMILGENIVPKIVEETYSLMDLNQLIIGIMNKKISLKKYDKVEMQFPTIMNQVIKDKYKEGNAEDYLYGFKVWINEKFKVVYTGNQKIKVYSLDNEDILLEENESKSIIKQMNLSKENLQL